MDRVPRNVIWSKELAMRTDSIVLVQRSAGRGLEGIKKVKEE